MRLPDVDMIKSYVYYNSNKYASLNLLNQLTFMFLFISSFPFACTIIGKAYPWSVVLLLITFVYAFLVICFNKKCNNINSFELRFFVNGILSTISSLYFLIYSYMMLSIKNSSKLSFVLITIFIYLLLFVRIIFTIINIKTKKHLKQQTSTQKNLLSYITIAVILGISLGKILQDSLTNNIKLDLAIYGASIISFLFSLGIENFLKYYFCKKYSITYDTNGENVSKLLIKENKWQPPIFMIILIFFFYLFITIGISVH